MLCSSENILKRILFTKIYFGYWDISLMISRLKFGPGASLDQSLLIVQLNFLTLLRIYILHIFYKTKEKKTFCSVYFRKGKNMIPNINYDKTINFAGEYTYSEM